MAGSRAAPVRTRILEAALALMAEGGARELTQPRVAKAAGVRQSHLTYYFPTRAELLQAVAYHSVAQLAPTLPAHARAGTLPEALAGAIADQRRTRTMLALIGAADRDPGVRARLRRFVREVRAQLAGALPAAGLTHGAADVAFLHTLVVGAAVLHLARDDTASRREARAVIRRAATLLARS